MNLVSNFIIILLVIRFRFSKSKTNTLSRIILIFSLSKNNFVQLFSSILHFGVNDTLTYITDITPPDLLSVTSWGELKFRNERPLLLTPIDLFIKRLCGTTHKFNCSETFCLGEFTIFPSTLDVFFLLNLYEASISVYHLWSFHVTLFSPFCEIWDLEWRLYYMFMSCWVL